MVAFPRKRNRFRRREKPRPAFDIRPLKKRGLGHSWRWDLDPREHLEMISFWRETSEFVGREEALRETL